MLILLEAVKATDGVSDTIGGIVIGSVVFGFGVILGALVYHYGVEKGEEK